MARAYLLWKEVTLGEDMIWFDYKENEERNRTRILRYLVSRIIVFKFNYEIKLVRF